MYNRVKFNQYESELFNFRFKRDPKIWSVEQVQDLWIRSKERARKRSLISSKVYDEIISEIPKNDKGCKLVYFSEDDTLYQYSFNWSTSFKSWGYSWNQVRFSDNKTISRDEKIDFILSNNKKAFELGEKYRDAKKLECKLQRRVLSIMCDMIENKLKEVYKDNTVDKDLLRKRIIEGIKKIPKIHTINNKKIVAITKTTSPDNYLVCFGKHTLGHNIPCQKTIVSKDHLINNNGKMIKAFEFIEMYDNVKKIKYNGETLYNVLLETHDTVIVNNMICETLHPSNLIAKIYAQLFKYKLEDQSRIIQKYNSKVKKTSTLRLKCHRK